ncbi:MAG: hypothetical protein P8171_01985, partial [Candidatus Thiodiazotropha sp.]
CAVYGRDESTEIVCPSAFWIPAFAGMTEVVGLGMTVIIGLWVTLTFCLSQGRSSRNGPISR